MAIWELSNELCPAGRAHCACHPANEDLFAGTPIRAGHFAATGAAWRLVGDGAGGPRRRADPGIDTDQPRRGVASRHVLDRMTIPELMSH